MSVQKYIIVMPSICLDGVYLSDFNGVVSPDYYDSEQEAWLEIDDFNKKFDGGEEHFPVLVTVDTDAGTLIDEYGFDWSMNIAIQVSDICIEPLAPTKN